MNYLKNNLEITLVNPVFLAGQSGLNSISLSVHDTPIKRWKRSSLWALFTLHYSDKAKEMVC